MASYFKAQEINKVEKQQLPESTVAVYSNITPKNKEEAKKLEDEILFAIKREHQLDMNRLIRGKELPKKLQKYFPSDFGGSGVICLQF
ncbi:hypothetical protein [Caminibacter pacificus]|uniref:Uncharacterized protein n=1 Tax=Caminibacter pacificus TaxID=1424653 RepID=A0AAJ4UX39_9BACT|nr:hypothetical protein [Caminibacter pacificus]QCI27449.1 hypothetical protein C6V80_00240 [Caminibacter pacificus]ROR38886.1 hypothetical protein EDC58_1801 [Caminibacter pacificus]